LCRPVSDHFSTCLALRQDLGNRETAPHDLYDASQLAGNQCQEFGLLGGVAAGRTGDGGWVGIAWGWRGIGEHCVSGARLYMAILTVREVAMYQAFDIRWL